MSSLINFMFYPEKNVFQRKIRMDTDDSHHVSSEMSSNVHHHERWEDNEDFSSIPGLFDPDGDIVLVFLGANGIVFLDLTSDPWYRATVPGDEIYTRNKTEGYLFYKPEEAASPMGCVRRFQFCNPSLSSNNCGPLTSWYDAQLEAAPLFGLTIEDRVNRTEPSTNNTLGSRYAWLIQLLALGQASIDNIIVDLGQDALTSLKYLSGGVMGPLPTNQWQLDVRYWWATFLASLQAAAVNTALGPTDPALDPYKVLPFNSHARDICNNQARHLVVHVCGLKLTLFKSL